MKKFIISALLICGGLGFYGCQDQLEDEYLNPEKYEAPESVRVRGMFSKMIYEWKVFVQDYGEWYYLAGGAIPKYAQITSYPLHQGFESNWRDWEKTDGTGFWDSQVNRQMYDLLERLRPWGVLKVWMENGSEEFKIQNQMYYDLMTIVREFCILRMVDLYNSFPYEDAVRGYEGIFFPKYDDPKEIYISCLNNIKTCSENLRVAYDRMSEEDKQHFQKQDLIFKGEINKWIQWANSVRLKHAVRMSGVEEAIAKEHIQDLVSKNNFPAEDFFFELPYDQYNDIMANTGITWVRGIADTYWHSSYLSGVMIDFMNKGTSAYEAGIDDARMPVIAWPTRFGDYRGVHMNRNHPYNNPTYLEVTGQTDDQRPDWVNDSQWGEMKKYIQNYSNGWRYPDICFNVNCVSPLNGRTFVMNDFPAYMMSRAEVELFLAEVNMKGFASTPKTAAEYIADAYRHSTDFWYDMIGYSKFDINTERKPRFPDADISMADPKKPADAVIEEYADYLKTEYNKVGDKLEFIMQQKYVHLNIMGTYELWAELRRTRRPKLEPITTVYIQNAKPMPERIKYHPDEPSKNPDNYDKVQSQDNFTTPIFWVKNPNETYYKDSYNID